MPTLALAVEKILLILEHLVQTLPFLYLHILLRQTHTLLFNQITPIKQLSFIETNCTVLEDKDNIVPSLYSKDQEN